MTSQVCHCGPEQSPSKCVCSYGLPVASAAHPLTPVTGPGELEGMRGTQARGLAGPRVSGLPLLPSGHVVGYSEAERAHRGGGHGHHQEGAVGKCPGGRLPGVRVYLGEWPFLLLPWLPLLGQPEPRAGQGCCTRCHGPQASCLPWALLQGASSNAAFTATFQKGAAKPLEEGDHSNAQEVTVGLLGRLPGTKLRRPGLASALRGTLGWSLHFL